MRSPREFLLGTLFEPLATPMLPGGPGFMTILTPVERPKEATCPGDPGERRVVELGDWMGDGEVGVGIVDEGVVGDGDEDPDIVGRGLNGDDLDWDEDGVRRLSMPLAMLPMGAEVDTVISEARCLGGEGG